MAPDNLNLRIQSLFHVQNPQPSLIKHPFFHLIGRRQSKKATSIRPRKRNDRGASQLHTLRNLGKVARGMLVLQPSKYQTSTFEPKQNCMSNSQYPQSLQMSSCFQLPQITPINISLTEGTDIPPPPLSVSPTKERSSFDDCQSTAVDEEHPPSLVEPTTNSSSSQDADEEATYKPLTPHIHSPKKKASSIRKFLSRRSLHANYTNESNYLPNLPRPESSMSYTSTSTCFSSGKKRNFSWMGRFSGTGDKFFKRRTSVVIEEKIPIEPPPPPPPPMLPHLSQFKATISEFDEGLGEDLFKNIK
ncbi:hypothetical protein OnM2_070049 [Erysiphe neolycopersici]|uniref:Uncharacterized protein n=1 Tax=Erysiphe neolycopersici TaxID=212602 RepID=A0A420HKS8_9PEZI|nr:hypothetical protein OnM2_070049 [Erysiphe neolycopersici]